MEHLPLCLAFRTHCLDMLLHGSTTTRAATCIESMLSTFPFFPANMWNTCIVRLTSIAISSYLAASRKPLNTSASLFNLTPPRIIHSFATSYPSGHPSINIVIIAAANLFSYWHASPATSSYLLPPGRASYH
jgi:hypothetical protein